MSITIRKDAKRDGTNPILLYGYGGFNVPMTPSQRMHGSAGWKWGAWLQPPEFVAGASSPRWRMAGTKSHKQNVFDDFHRYG